jgi:amidohydrolase
MNLKDEIRKVTSEIIDEIIIIRRHLHQNPELSFLEYETSSYIKKSLDNLNIEWTPVADTGVIATIVGKKDKGSDKTIVLRADIDALPIEEKTKFPFKSLNQGVMHACGHDIHTSSLLGVAHILKRLEHKFKGTVKLVFQPAEEILPGGAIKILEEEVLQNCNVDIVVGQHIMPSVYSGKIALREGKFMASMDEIRIKITGRGGMVLNRRMLKIRLLQQLQL